MYVSQSSCEPKIIIQAPRIRKIEAMFSPCLKMYESIPFMLSSKTHFRAPDKRGIADNSKIIVHISQQKHML